MLADRTGQRFGNYKIVGRLGEGGVATVYRAEQLNIKREVALKILKVEGEDNAYIHRLQREAHTIGQLSHPHILKLFDFGHENGITYLVTELITGGSLAERIRQGPLPPEEVGRILQQLASALDHAHREGIIHRDLKPHNILLDRDGNVLLSDFGVARLIQSVTAISQSGSVVGTPAYMAPEQWSGDSADARTDIYSLGVVVFEMLTGTLPFRSETPYRMMHMHLYDSPPYIHSLDASLPLSLDVVLSKALDKDPEQRFVSAGEMSEAFQAALKPGPAPIAADSQDTIRLPKTEERLSNPVARKASPWFGLGMIAIAILLGMLLGLSYLGSRNANAQAVDVPGELVQMPTSPTLFPTETTSVQQTVIAVVGATDTANAVASFTSTSLPTLTPSMTQTLPSIAVMARSRADFAHVRTGPSLYNAILRNLAKGYALTVESQTTVGPDVWYQVNLPAGTVTSGWVLAKEVVIEPPDAVIPTAVAVPASPVPATRTPTSIPTDTPVGANPGPSGGTGSSGGGGGKSGGGGCVPLPLAHVGC